MMMIFSSWPLNSYLEKSHLPTHKKKNINLCIESMFTRRIHYCLPNRRNASIITLPVSYDGTTTIHQFTI
jgi:hypothetical protein